MGTCTITRRVPCHKVDQFINLAKIYNGRLGHSFTVSPDLDYVWACVELPDVQAMKGFDEDWRRCATNIVEKTREYSRWQKFKNKVKGLLK